MSLTEVLDTENVVEGSEIGQGVREVRKVIMYGG